MMNHVLSDWSISPVLSDWSFTSGLDRTPKSVNRLPGKLILGERVYDHGPAAYRHVRQDDVISRSKHGSGQTTCAGPLRLVLPGGGGSFIIPPPLW